MRLVTDSAKAVWRAMALEVGIGREQLSIHPNRHSGDQALVSLRGVSPPRRQRR